MHNGWPGSCVTSYKLKLQYTVLKTNIATIKPKLNHLSNNVLLAFYYRWKLHRKEEGIFTLDDVSSKIPNYNNLLIYYILIIVIIHCIHFLSFHWFCLQAKGAGAQIFPFLWLKQSNNHSHYYNSPLIKLWLRWDLKKIYYWYKASGNQIDSDF